MLVRHKADHNARPSVRCQESVPTTENWGAATRALAVHSHQLRRWHLELFGGLLDSRTRGFRRRRSSERNRPSGPSTTASPSIVSFSP
jgi:hypothetical protein